MVRIETISTAGALLALLVAESTRFTAGADATAFFAHQLRRALATTSTSTNECATETQACSADSECITCSGVFPDMSESCSESIGLDTCADLQDVVCCASSASCEDNAAYTEFVGASRSGAY